jgi:hypothetical protein
MSGKTGPSVSNDWKLQAVLFSDGYKLADSLYGTGIRAANPESTILFRGDAPPCFMTHSNTGKQG